MIGIDAHMRSHTAVVVDAGTGRKLGELTVPADEVGHAKLKACADREPIETHTAPVAPCIT